MYEVTLDPPFIHSPTKSFDFADPPFDPIQFSKDLVETMLANGGIGLAAAQIGVDYSIVAILASPVIVMFNPKIVGISSEEIELEEGCLSFPSLWLKIRRPKTIRVRYYQPNGNVITSNFEGMSARVIQHEIDHTLGITMIDRLPKIKQESAKNKVKQMKRRTK